MLLNSFVVTLIATAGVPKWCTLFEVIFWNTFGGWLYVLCTVERCTWEGPGNRPYFNISYSKKYNPRYLQVCTIVCIIYDAHYRCSYCVHHLWCTLYRRSYLDLKRINVIILVLSRFTTKLKLKRRHFSPPSYLWRTRCPCPKCVSLLVWARCRRGRAPRRRRWCRSFPTGPTPWPASRPGTPLDTVGWVD